MKTRNKSTVKIILGATILLLLLGYGFFQARNLLYGPSIVITAPTNGESLQHHLINITGIASNASNISMNDRQIFIDKEGNFSEKLLASPGYNIIKLAAQDRFGRTVHELIELNYSATDIAADMSSATGTEEIIQ